MSETTAVRFEGHEERECGEHRTTGPRAWCFDCSEWCYPKIPCKGCELPSLRTAIGRLRVELAEARKAYLAVIDAAELRGDVDHLKWRLRETEAERDALKAKLAEAEGGEDEALSVATFAADKAQSVRRERDALKAAEKRVRALHARNAHTGDCEYCSQHDYPDYATPWPCQTIAALDAPETPGSMTSNLEVMPAAEIPKKPSVKAINVPDRIDYDSDGELDDIVVNDCMAHLERLDGSRWYLGLYGGDGRILQIDIASKTGRAEVTGFVKYSEGIPAAPETPGDA